METIYAIGLLHGVRAFGILEVQFGSCGYIGILLVSK